MVKLEFSGGKYQNYTKTVQKCTALRNRLFTVVYKYLSKSWDSNPGPRRMARNFIGMFITDIPEQKSTTMVKIQAGL